MADAVVDGWPRDALVVLVGPAGSGKSTWARGHVEPDAILSSDAIRAQVAGDASDQSANADTFKVLHAIARARLRRGLLTVIDATNLTEGARRALLRLARGAGRPAVAVAFETSLERCLAQNAARAERHVPDDVVRRHHQQLGRALEALPQEGFSAIHIVSPEDVKPV